MSIAALSVITEPSGSTSVGICASGFTRFNSSRPGPGSHDAASTMRKGCRRASSAASAAAEPGSLAARIPACQSRRAVQGTDCASGAASDDVGPLLHHLRHAAVDLLGRHVLDVRGDGPHVAEGIDERAAAVAVELVHDRPLLRGARRERLPEDAVDVLHVDHEADRRAAEGLRAAVTLPARRPS